jgi:hypothetical protein
VFLPKLREKIIPMAAPPIPAVWCPFLVNLFLQVFDGVLTYQVLLLGVPEANPLVRNAITAWGAAWGLIYWKGLACILLALIFAFRHKQQALTVKALTLTAAVYAYVSAAGLCVLFL